MANGSENLDRCVCGACIRCDSCAQKWKQLVMDERYVCIDVKDKGLCIFSSCSRAYSTPFPGSALPLIGEHQTLVSSTLLKTPKSNSQVGLFISSSVAFISVTLFTRSFPWK